MSIPKETHGDQNECECPYCGEKIKDIWDYGDLQGMDEITCGWCDKTCGFHAYISCDITLTAKEENGSE